MNFKKIENSFESSENLRSARGEIGIVSSAHPRATEAGIKILEFGGNAIDSAVATAFALGVCEPQASGLGGQSLGILHINGKTIAIDGSSRAPSLAHKSKFKRDSRRLYGYKSTTVPSTPAFLEYILNRYGTLDIETILEPAIKIARTGYKITQLQHDLQKRETKNFKKISSNSGGKYFLLKGKHPHPVGSIFKQKDLANTLEHLATYGIRDFYQGKIAKQIDKDMINHGGYLRADDLAFIPRPVERRPISRRYRNLTVFTLPPPAAGKTLLLVLLMLNNIPNHIVREKSNHYYHLLAETFRKAFLHRIQVPIEPNRYAQVQDKRMLNRKYARNLVLEIKDKIDPNLPLVDPKPVGVDTTHLSVMDNHGNAIGITQSIERVYGSKACADGLGFIYNNYMSQYNVTNPSHVYYLRPNNIPWTTVSPLIAFHKKKPWLTAGSPGSERIFSTVSQFLSNVVDCDMSIEKAMIEPRFHCSIGGKISLESEGFNSSLIDYLKSMGYIIDPRERFSFYLGAIHAVIKTQTIEGFQGVAEIRRDGMAGGL